MNKNEIRTARADAKKWLKVAALFEKPLAERTEQEEGNTKFGLCLAAVVYGIRHWCEKVRRLNTAVKRRNYRTYIWPVRNDIVMRTFFKQKWTPNCDKKRAQLARQFAEYLIKQADAAEKLKGTDTNKTTL